MDGFSSKDMLYGILGATLADKRSDTDAKLPRNELAKIGLLNAMSAASKNPAFSMLTAKIAADAKIEAATAIARNLVLEAELRKYREKVKKIKALSNAAEISQELADSFDTHGQFVTAATTSNS